ncbi:chitin binding protein [Lachnospiraceae bacterium KM106-2]|nr:chitin binding protein [Lachnospiraceae bacterium KM106-2]
MKSVYKVMMFTFVLCMGILLMPVESKAQKITDTWGGDAKLTWSYDDQTKELVISGTGTPTGEFAYYHEGGIKFMEYEPWQNYQKQIEKVVIEEGLTEIPETIFSKCTNLKSVLIPKSVTKIGKFAFYGDQSLQEVQLPDSIVSIDKEAFSRCTNLKSVTIGTNTKTIGEHVFAGCKKLEGITVSDQNPFLTSKDGVLYSKDQSILYAYPGAKAGAYVVPDEVKTVDAMAFAWSQNLTQVTIGKNVTLLKAGAFYGCPKLKKVLFVSGCKLEKMEDYYEAYGDELEEYYGTFGSCTALTSITLPDALKQFGTACFKDCVKLTKITIGSKFENFYDFSYPKGKRNQFICSKKLSAISVSSKNKYFSTKDGVLYNKKRTQINMYPVAKTNSKFVIPTSVTVIGDGAFYQAKKLANVSMSNKVTKISDYAFDQCSGLKSIKMSSKIRLVGRSAFSGCKKLTAIVIPGNKTEIGWDAFWNCASLKKVTLKYGVKKIKSEAFFVQEGKPQLKSIYIPKSVTTIEKHSIGYYEHYWKDRNGCDTNQTQKIKNFVIYGKKGSAAEKYAKNNHITFKRK